MRTIFHLCLLLAASALGPAIKHTDEKVASEQEDPDAV